ncbi:hypothetical protein [Streptosporangium sp. H16]|uniref:hypothetical protein n=1 Tax=Streptosporangium sp. H16 TaxID=3444184 RepID=UPI003F7988DC
MRGTKHGDLHGHDGDKKALGAKRHLLVDTLGIALGACAIRWQGPTEEGCGSRSPNRLQSVLKWAIVTTATTTTSIKSFLVLRGVAR